MTKSNQDYYQKKCNNYKCYFVVNVVQLKARRQTTIVVRNIKLFCIKIKPESEAKLFNTLVIITKTQIKSCYVISIMHFPLVRFVPSQQQKIFRRSRPFNMSNG